MGFYDWMLALHLLAAFAVASALVLFTVLVATSGSITSREDAELRFRIGRIGGPLIGAGMGLVLVFGIVLAIASDDFEPWSGWVILGVVLWALMGFVGGRTGKYFEGAQKLSEGGADQADVIALLRAPTGRWLTLANLALFLLILLDMVFKPGQ